MRKNISIFVFVLSLAALFAVSASIYSQYKPYGDTAQRKTGNNLKPNIQITDVQNDTIIAPDFKLKDINGKEISLSDYKGKIVILNFWATWCKYCKIEMPDLNEVNKGLDKYNAVLFAIDVQEDISIVKSYLSQNKINLKVLMDSNGSVAQSYNVSSFPMTYIINKDGSIYTSILGLTNKEAILGILDNIKDERK